MFFLRVIACFGGWFLFVFLGDSMSCLIAWFGSHSAQEETEEELKEAEKGLRSQRKRAWWKMEHRSDPVLLKES